HPTNTIAAEGSTPVLTSAAYGPPPLTYQWYQSSDFGGSFQPLLNRTNSTLGLTNVPVANDQYQYFSVATDPYGSTTSSVAVLSVISGPPQVLTDVPTITHVYAGYAAQITATIGGTSPFSYQWMSNGVNLSNGGRISGANSNTLTISYTVPSDSAV